MSSSIRTARSLAFAWILCVILILLPAVIAQRAASHEPASVRRWAYNRRDETITISRIVGLCPPSDVVVIGNSRAREAVIAPFMNSALRLHPGAVRNYGASAASAIAEHALALLLQRSHKMPRVILYPVSPRDLTRGEVPSTNFLPLADAWELLDRPSESFRDLLLSAASRHIALLWIKDAYFNSAVPAMPALGDFTGNQEAHRIALLESRQRSFAAHSQTPSAIADYMRTNEMGSANGLDAEAEKCAERIIELGRDNGCAIIVAELPLSSAMRSAYPPGIYDDFLNFFQRTCDRGQATFVRLADLDVTFTDEDISDATHCNWTGAAKFTLALAPWVAKALRPDALRTGPN